MSGKFNYDRVRADGGVAYYRGGAGAAGAAAVLLIHGVGLCAESWLYQIPALEKTHAVYALDIAGHGASPALSDSDANTSPCLDDYLNNIREFIDSVVQQPFIIIGHSLGALLALHLAAHESCRGVVALNAVYQRPPAAAAAVAARLKSLRAGEDNIDATLQRWFGKDTSSVAADLCRQWLTHAVAENRRGYVDAYAVFANENNVTPQLLQSLKIPALFITGEGDSNSTAAMSQAMAKEINLAHRAPSTQVCVIPRARHMAMLTHATTVNKVISHFMRYNAGHE